MIYVLLPARDDERGLERLLRRIREVASVSAEPWRVVVVDDGSTDETAAVAGSFARSLDIWLVRHGRRDGLGAALRTGVRLVLEHAAETDDVLVTMDADDSHDPELIPVLVRALRKRVADVAIASRFARGAREVGLPPHRRALSRVAAALYRVAVPLPGVRDYSSGYRAFRLDALREARAAAGRDIPESAGSGAAVELLLRLRTVGATAAEVPLVLRHDRRPRAGRTRLPGAISASGRLLARALVQRLARPLPAGPARGALALRPPHIPTG